MGWMRANKLKLNPDKTEVLLVGGSGFGEGELNLVLNGVALLLRDKVRSLGVLLNPELSLEAQVTAVARSAFLQLQLIRQLRPYLEYDCLATVTHALVTSRLDFCNTLYVGLPLKTVWILQLVQNRAARLLTGTGRYVHMTPVLCQLHWLPIEVRAQFKVLVMTYKALNSLGPGYLKERLRPYMPTRPLRSVGEALLQEPSVKEIRRALLFLASISGLCFAISLVLICVYLVRFCCCSNEDDEETKTQRVCCVTWSCVAAVIVCCAGIGIGFYGNSETNDGVYQVTYSLLNANHTLSSIDTLVSETVELLSATVRGELTQLEETLSPRTELVAVVRNTRRQAEAVAQTLDGIPFWGESRGGPSLLAEQVGDLEDYRWLAYILLLLLDLVICLFTLLGLAKQIKWLVIVMTVMSFFVLILSWGSMGLETAGAVGLSDFCFEPDGYVMNTTQARTGLSPEILQYYLTCSQDIFNPFQQRLTLCQRALSNIHSQLYGLEREAVPHFPASEVSKKGPALDWQGS
ncbi:hypothetical protein EYD10_14545 [Varanus komodoensis]|nr:hypothetical protein EYD10_14545 [Varanus komodoensis]